jgi:outer membrane protein assembly factor BamB
MSTLTQHNNNQRTGINFTETKLTLDTVRTSFSRLKQLPVDPPDEGGPTHWASQIVAQPLLASDVDFGGGTMRDVLIVATMHGTVYAYDATHHDNPAHSYPTLWATWLGQPVQNLPGFDQKDIHGTNPEWGILSTPVIDAGRKRVYVVMWNGDDGGTFRLHSLDLLNGQDTAPAAVVEGHASKPDAQPVFDPVFQKQRPGLLLVTPEDLPAADVGNVGPDGTIYIGFGASTEFLKNYHGWVFAYDARTLKQVCDPWCSTTRGTGGGIWQAGQGLVADSNGNLYLMTGNGTFDGTDNFSQSFVKLSGKDLTLLDYFTPWNWPTLNQNPDVQDDNDLDLGSAGPVCIGSKYVLGGGKEGRLYVLDADQMGKLGDAAAQKDGSIDELQAAAPAQPHHQHRHHVHGSPPFFEHLGRVYIWAEEDVLRAFHLDDNGQFDPRHAVATGNVTAPNGMPGGMMSASANGTNDAILWVAVPLNGDANRSRLVTGVLRAFDADTLDEIWNSHTPPGNELGSFAKFSPPTVANGRVYVPTYDGQLNVYGLR